MVLSCQNISKAFGVEEILRGVSFHIENNEKAAIIGMNGAGKSTLLKIVMGEVQPDEGEVILAKGKTVGYLSQQIEIGKNLTIYEEVLSAKQEIIEMEERIRKMELQMKHLEGEELEQHLESYNRLCHEFELADGYSYKSETVGILKGLGFGEDEFEKRMKELSGGQKTRVALGKLLVSKPDVLLLDEPTNHLDIESISWLETFLLNYKGAVVIVAHDRYFLDKVVTKIIEIERHQSTVYQGNYTEYAQKKQILRVAQINAYLNQQREIKHQEDVIEKLKSFNREKSIKRAESREKALDKVDRLEKPVEEKNQMQLNLDPLLVSGKDVLHVEALSKSFEHNLLFSNLTFDIYRGEKVAFIGANGTGKTTLLKIICDMIPADEGTIHLGANVQVGYYDQEHKGLHNENTLFDEIADAYPDLTNTQIRNTLAAFLFTEDDVFKQIGDISGGEKGRVALAKLMLSGANFLILDEPTNHLDIVSKEILEDVINSYTGTVLYVSHDRYFINKTATRILNITERQVVNYIGNYDYYLEKKDELSPSAKGVLKGEENQSFSDETDAKLDWKQQKELQAAKRKKENELKSVEETISNLEDVSQQLEAKLLEPENVTNSAKLNELTTKLDQVKKELEKAYEQWELLAEA